MKTKLKLITLLTVFLTVFSCNKNEKTQTTAETTTDSIPVIEYKEPPVVEMVTDFGTIKMKLFNETPKHRDNFIKLAKEGVMDSMLFHRVINEFMIQTSVPTNKYTRLSDTSGTGALDYKIDAEFHPDLFHKRGALAAARDGNPERASASTSFYIVQRGPRNDSLLDVDESRINKWLAEHYARKTPMHKTLTYALEQAIKDDDQERYRMYTDSLSNYIENYTDYEPYTIPEAHREVYRTIGGAAHLDQNYTVFGEVLEGMNVVDSIAHVEVNRLNRPLKEIRIQSVKILEPKE